MNVIKSSAYLIAIVSLGFAACGGDDPDNPKLDSALPSDTGGARLDGAAFLDTRRDSQPDSPIPSDSGRDSGGFDGPTVDAPTVDAPSEGAICSGPGCPDGGIADADVISTGEAGTSTWACVNDNNCQLESDYCDGCNCLALGQGSVAPTCKGTIVNCFADPCLVKVPRCLNGQCVAANKTN